MNGWPNYGVLASYNETSRSAFIASKNKGYRHLGESFHGRGNAAPSQIVVCTCSFTLEFGAPAGWEISSISDLGAVVGACGLAVARLGLNLEMGDDATADQGRFPIAPERE